MAIGKLVKSNTHTDYVCQIYGPGEIERLPVPVDYAFGNFVRIPLGAGYGYLVGVIYDTMLLNPDFGNLGPRLSPPSDLAVFSPDYLAEKVTLVGITAVGMISPADVPTHGIPPLAAQIDTLVERMDDAAVRVFHQTPSGNVQVGYAPLLLASGSSLAGHLLLRVLARLEQLFPAQSSPLAVLRNELIWQTTIGPLGGGA
ncbi:MAG: hypothetical protein BWY63_01991 [Chloroflexi bacterium ADurb.Bin360]|nr:MAG: hypothetical protein BWY63_01991 [Chloroflexi bacterium ADurb.Bin360]